MFCFVIPKIYFVEIYNYLKMLFFKLIIYDILVIYVPIYFSYFIAARERQAVIIIDSDQRWNGLYRLSI